MRLPDTIFKGSFVKKKFEINHRIKNVKKKILSFYSKLSCFFRKIKANLKTLRKKFLPLFRYIRKNKYLLFAITLFVVIFLLWQFISSWFFQSSFLGAKTFPKATVFDINVGNLNVKQLEERLVKLKSDFESGKIILIGDDDKKWIFNTSELGISLDYKTTAKSVQELNNLSFTEKYRLSANQTNKVITPTISIDNDKCLKSLSIIPVVQVQPENALIYYENGLKIKPDKSGTAFSASSTCKDLPKKLASGLSETNVSLEISKPNVSKTDLESVFPKIQTMIGESLSLNSNNFQLTLTPEQLFDMLEISKTDSNVNVSWSLSKLDELIDGIASKINTYESGSISGVCQYVASGGGNWLDNTATKNIFENLGVNKSRSYNLTMTYHKPVMKTISPVASGSNGTVYLTFDDGMAFGDQIMNYASCYGVKVTFFEVGERAFGDATGLRRAIAEGHAVQSHGHYHALFDYGQRGYEWQYNDIYQSIIDIQSITGVRPTYFRPPGGNRSDSTYQAASANGVNLILWGVSSGDGANISTSLTCSNVLSRTFNGATILLHSTRQSTANAVPCIIEGLANRGFNMKALR